MCAAPRFVFYLVLNSNWEDMLHHFFKCNIILYFKKIQKWFVHCLNLIIGSVLQYIWFKLKKVIKSYVKPSCHFLFFIFFVLALFQIRCMVIASCQVLYRKEERKWKAGPGMNYGKDRKGKEMDRTAGRKEEKKEGSMEKGRQEGTIQEKGKNTGMKAG